MLTPSFLNRFITRGQSSSVLEMAAEKIKKKKTHQKTKKYFRKLKSTFYRGCERKTGT